jgi:hypothetical protein
MYVRYCRWQTFCTFHDIRITKDGDLQSGSGYNFGLEQGIDTISAAIPVFSIMPDQMLHRAAHYDAD